MYRRSPRGVLALAASTALLAAASATAMAAPPAKAGNAAGPANPANAECATGRGIPDSQISIQLWTFVWKIGWWNTDAATQARLEEVLRRLSEMGYRNVEPYSLNGLTAEQFDALLEKYDLKAPSRHGDANEATWDQELAISKTLGQHFTGSGGFAEPGIGSYEDVLATAERLNRLGKRSVENGTGPIFGHNHQYQFQTKYVDPETGELKSAWQIIVENTDPRYVVFQVDILWAIIGGADPVELLERYGDRIALLHVKDGINLDSPNPTQVPVGQGEVNFEPILEAAKGKVRYYVYEQDPPSPFDEPTFDPFASARAGIEYLDCVTS